MRTRFAGPVVFAVILAVLGAVWLGLRVAGRTTPTALPTASAHRGGTKQVVCTNADRPDGCARYIEDILRRLELDDSQRAAGSAIVERVFQVVESALPAPSCGTGSGYCRVPAARPADVRHALTAAGFRDVAVRLAGAGDVATAGTLLYAVGSGPACVLGYGRGSRPLVAGRLPDGTCLASA